MAIIQSLFEDMLPRTMQDGGGRGGIGMPMPPQAPQIGLQAPVMQPQVAPPVQPQVQPPVQEQVKPVAQQPMGLAQPQQPQVAGGFTVPQNIDLSGFGGGLFNLGMPQQPQAAQDPADFFNQYADFLSGVQSGNTANKVNRRDDIYNNFFNQAGMQYTGTPEEFRSAVGLSDVFATYDNPETTIDSLSVQDAYSLLTGSEDPTEALSQYYGFDFQPTTNEGANYTNARKYGTDAERMAEFQSLVEPILQKAIPYIQATQGLDYTDALEYAYTHDPMVAALYGQYGVDLYRKTKDGSTYIFDPIAGQEIRTLEVKDPKFKDYAPALAGIALSFTGIPAAIGSAFGASGATAAGIGNAITSMGTAALGGQRGSDLLKAGVLGGLGGYAKSLQATANEALSALETSATAGNVGSLTATYDAAQAAANTATTIFRSAKAIDAIANKDYIGAVNLGLIESGVTGGIDGVVGNYLDKLSGGSSTLLGLDVKALAPALSAFGTQLLSGADTEDALRRGVLAYVKEGGLNLSYDKTPEAIKAIEDAIRQVGSKIDDTFFQPLKDATGGLVDTLDNLIQTPDSIKGIEDFFRDLPDKVDNAIDTPDSIKAIEDYFKDLASGLGDGLDLDLSGVDIGLGGVGGGGELVSTRGLPDFLQIEDTVPTPELFAQRDYLQELFSGQRL